MNKIKQAVYGASMIMVTMQIVAQMCFAPTSEQWMKIWIGWLVLLMALVVAWPAIVNGRIAKNKPNRCRICKCLIPDRQLHCHTCNLKVMLVTNRKEGRGEYGKEKNT